MEGQPMHMGRQNQYCENDYTTESNPYQNYNDVLQQDRKAHVEAQKTPNSQGSAEPKEQSWWHHNT
jgi:hypothetical protein